MLPDNFYNILRISFENEDTEKYSADITLNPLHEIFSGHFPGSPVTPGVCLMDIITEIAGKCKNAELKLQSADVVKFLKIVVPENDMILTVDMQIKNFDKNTLSVNAVIRSAGEVNLKFRGKLELI